MTKKRECSFCFKSKLLSEFYVCSGVVRPECKACTKEKRRIYVEKMRQVDENYPNCPKLADYRRKYYNDNKEKFAKYRAEFNARNPKYFDKYKGKYGNRNKKKKTGI